MATWTAAVPRRRDQAAEAARGAARECREGAHLAPARAARRQGRARRAARRSRGARTRCAQADRVSEGDGIFHPHPPRRGVFADRSGRYRGRMPATRRRQRASPLPRRSPLMPPATCFRGDSAAPRGEGHLAAPTGRTKPASLKGTPVSLAQAREEAIKKIPIDRKKYQTIRSLDALKAWIARVTRRRPFRDRRDVDFDRSDAGGNFAASRWRWRRTMPPMCRSATSSPAAARACSMPGWRRTRSRPADALAALKPLLESAGHPQDRLQHQIHRGRCWRSTASRCATMTTCS